MSLCAPLGAQHAVLRSLLTITILPAPKRGGMWTNEWIECEPVVAE